MRFFAHSCLLYVLFLTSSLLHAQTRFLLSGLVTDSASGEPLVAVTIRVAGTSYGTITNSNGLYNLSLERGKQTVIVSSIGYHPETLQVNVVSAVTRNIKLQESPVIVPEMVISAEDPAIEIIRKAIANKRKWMDRLTSYSFEAFTRQTLRRDTAIASITESYSTGYMRGGDTLREVIKQKRQTQNIPLDDNSAAVRGIVNFNEDRISLFRISINNSSSGYTFVGPTAPDALEYYDYKLLGVSEMNGIEIYTIRMTPKSRIKPLFDGTIIIADETFAVMGVDVVPNETFAIPFIKEISLRYKQQFSLYDSLFWMPSDIRIAGFFGVSFIGISLPKIGIEQTSAIYDYKVNVPIPDSILKKPRLAVDSSAAVFDSLFWQQTDVLPLTQEEQTAYQSLDSTQTLEKQFEPKGPLASIGDDGTGLFLDYIDARFNRVEGFFFGGRYSYDSLPYNITARASAGYGFSDTTFKFNAGATVFTSTKRSLGFGTDVYHRLGNIPDEGYYGPIAISLMSLIDKNDYRDYYFAKGWRAFTLYKPTRTLSMELGYQSEKQTSMRNNTDYSLFGRGKVFRQNPLIQEGTMNSLALHFRWGREPVPLGLISTNAFELTIEHSSPSMTGGDFDFTGYRGMLEWNVVTFGGDLLFPPKLGFKLSAGTTSGSPPPQRYFALDSRASGYAPFGVLRGSNVKEFSGNRFVMLNIEHNFRSVPFLLLDMPFLYKNSIELIVHSSIAQTWVGTTSTSNGWYSEAGIGINRIFDILRMDITYRIAEPGSVWLSMSAANLF